MSKICELEKQLAGRQEEIEKIKGGGRGVYALPGVHYAGKPGEGLGGLGPGLGPGSGGGGGGGPGLGPGGGGGGGGPGGGFGPGLGGGPGGPGGGLVA
jgi:hypothetical protein